MRSRKHLQPRRPDNVVFEPLVDQIPSLASSQSALLSATSLTFTHLASSTYLWKNKLMQVFSGLVVCARPPGGGVQLGGEEQPQPGGGVHHKPGPTQLSLQARHQRPGPAQQLQDGLG